MIRIRKHFKLFILLFILSFSLLFKTTILNALSGGVSLNKGYFSNSTISSSGNGPVLATCTSGQDPITSAMTNKTTFINKIMDYYNGCGITIPGHGDTNLNVTRNKIGARFIILSMIDKRPTTFTTTSYNETNFNNSVTAADLREFVDRVNNPDVLIGWSSSISRTVNSGYAYSNGFFDNVFYASSNSSPGLYFYNKNDTTEIYYKIKHDCANPVGTVPLPDYEEPWHVNPTVSVKSDSSVARVQETTVYPGGAITWLHAADNLGSVRATQAVTFGSVDPPYTYGNIDGTWRKTLGAGTAGDWLESTYYVAAGAAIGTRYCRATAVSYSTPTVSWAVSGPACATVIAPPAPLASWSLVMSTKVQKTSPAGVVGGFVNNIIDAMPGDTITWEHTIKNNGPDATDVGIKYNYLNNLSLTGRTLLSSGSEQSIASGFTLNETKTKKSYFVWSALTKLELNNNDVGKTFCRRTIVNKKSSSDVVKSAAFPLLWYQEPTQACVTVIALPWQLTLSTSIKKTAENGDTEGYKSTDINAKPKEKITWKHTIKNGDENATNTDVKYGYVNEVDLTPPYGDTKTISEGFAKNAVESKESGAGWGNTLEITQDDVGKQYCRNTVVDQISSTASKITSLDLATWYKGPTRRCVTIPYDYILLPTVTNVNTTASGFNVDSKVGNHLGPTKSRPTYWRLTRLENSTAPANLVSSQSGDISSSNPCSFFTGWIYCDNVKEGTGVTFEVGDEILNYSDPNPPNGFSKVCYALSVKSYNQDTPGNWRHSNLFCVENGKKPKVQVWGGDVWSKSDITMDTTLASSNTYGSWGEYALFSRGAITMMASKSVFVNLGTPTVCDFSPLSFTNVNCATTIGSYVSSRNIPDISASYSLTSGTILSGDHDVGGLSGQYIGNGTDITLYGTVDTGKTVIINAPTSNVTISGDIQYPNDTIASISDIPQLLIIAKNINILSSVENVDAWLVAKEGTIDTCSNIPLANIRIYDDCNNPLRVNGPVIAKTLLLHRTFGSDPSPSIGLGTPAEIFNLRADAYLWAAAQSSGGNTIKTVYSVDQPPRF